MEVHQLKQELEQMKQSKLELIRSTSIEIERLRRIVRILTGTDSMECLDEMRYKLPVPDLTPPVILAETDAYPSDATLPTSMMETSGPPKVGEMDDEEMKISEDYHARGTAQEEEKVEEVQEGPAGDALAPAAAAATATAAAPEAVESVTPKLKPSAHEEARERKSKQADMRAASAADSAVPPPLTKQKTDTLFRLSAKRMSHMGFEFSDFGFMTTDFDQLSRGHQSWINQILHHAVQNGIIISASDDWSVMFWRFRRVTGKEGLIVEHHQHLNKKRASPKAPKTPVHDDLDESDTHILNALHSGKDHKIGEILLFPVLKINTGLEVKAVQMSRDGTVLAVSCFDDEEDDGNPELQLYFDEHQRWTFHQDQFRYGSAKDPKDDRVIKRKIIPLEFEPVPRGVGFTWDGRKVFLAMFSTRKEVREVREKLQSSGADDELDEYPEEACTLVCVDTQTRMVTKCEEINSLMRDDEHVQCMQVSPDGTRIAIGTNKGRLLVTGTAKITDPNYSPEEANPIWNKLWIAEESFGHSAGALTAVGWSEDSNWIVTGYGCGLMRLWKKNKEARVSMSLNKTLSRWMKKAKVLRRTRLFKCLWELEGEHLEAVNTLSIRGSLLTSGSDDGTVIVWDLMQTFANHETTNQNANAPIRLARIKNLHHGRMVNSVSLSNNYNETDLLIPSAGLFLASSGGDNDVHCLSLLDVMRDAIRREHYRKLGIEDEAEEEEDIV